MAHSAVDHLDDGPPTDDALLRTNAWYGQTATSRAEGNFDQWGLTRLVREPGKQPLGPKAIDYKNWRDPRVGWGIILPESEADAKDKARGADAPDCIKTLVAERSKVFAVQGGVPVFRYRDDLELGLLRRYQQDGRPSDPGLGGERGVAANAVPSYLLVVGSPKEIPWRVQYRLQLNAYVGRLDLEPEGLDRYVEALLSDWNAAKVRKATPVFWSADYGAQDITRLMRRTIAEKLSQRFAQDDEKEFDLTNGVFAATDATHTNLIKALHERSPAFVVTTSHGSMEPPAGPESLSTRLGLPLDAEHATLDLDALSGGWSPHGSIWYAHACCSAGCQGVSAFAGVATQGSTLASALEAASAIGPCTSPLPKRLLGGASPARAFVGHVEPTFDWTLRDSRNGQTLTAPIINAFYDQLQHASRPPVGYALDTYHRLTGGLWRDYNDARDELQNQQPAEAKVRRTKLVASDREALVLLGDPTVSCG